MGHDEPTGRLRPNTHVLTRHLRTLINDVDNGGASAISVYTSFNGDTGRGKISIKQYEYSLDDPKGLHPGMPVLRWLVDELENDNMEAQWRGHDHSGRWSELEIYAWPTVGTQYKWRQKNVGATTKGSKVQTKKREQRVAVESANEIKRIEEKLNAMAELLQVQMTKTDAVFREFAAMTKTNAILGEFTAAPGYTPSPPNLYDPYASGSSVPSYNPIPTTASGTLNPLAPEFRPISLIEQDLRAANAVGIASSDGGLGSGSDASGVGESPGIVGSASKMQWQGGDVPEVKLDALGHVVTLCDLKKCAGLNGATGVVLRYEHDKQRYQVRIPEDDGSSRVIKVKRQNLQLGDKVGQDIVNTFEQRLVRQGMT